MIEGPQAIDDREIVACAVADTYSYAYLSCEYLNFAFVAPFARRRTMRCCIGVCLAWLDFADDRIEAFAHLFVPIFFFGRRVAANDECSIRTASIPHISSAAI